MLLRVVATAGAGALLACSSASGSVDDACTHGACDGGADAADEHVVNGVVAMEGGSDASEDHVVVGTVPNHDGGADASDDHFVTGSVDGGIIVNPDGGEDGPVGVVVHPDSGTD